MELKFEPIAHKYESIDDPDKKWTSVTTLISLFKEPFDQEKISKLVSRKKKSKWYGIEPNKIIEFWDKEAKRGNDLGSWYHDQRENETLSCDTVRRENLDLPIFRSITDGDIKLSPDQQLVPGIYPEHFVYLKSASICGQADRVEVIGDRVDIYDYKTNKAINKQSYVNWEGISKKMKPPLEHLDDCNLMHYALQLSLYMYIILKHNHHLKPGNIIVQHVEFEVESVDEFGFPTTATGPDGQPIVKEVLPYEVSYLKREVQDIIKYLKMNPKLL
jgi:hypothetical protein